MQWIKSIQYILSFKLIRYLTYHLRNKNSYDTSWYTIVITSFFAARHSKFEDKLSNLLLQLLV